MRTPSLALGWLLSLPLGATTFTVVNTNDSGPGSLRQAIQDANATPGADTIAFNIPGSGVHTITPIGLVPPITDSTIIDGYTQPGASPNTQLASDDAVLLIEISGESASSSDGLIANAAPVTIRGLVINRFDTNVFLNGGGHRLEGCFIGTDPTGTIARGSAGGVIAWSSTIGGSLPSQRNVISGNNGVGILANGTVIQGNFIGIDATGTVALPNSINVSVPWGASAALGGLAEPAGVPPGNVISGSLGSGVDISTSETVDVQGNLIGTNAAGAAGVPNLGHGIVIQPGAGAMTTIGGAEPGAGNVIAFNGGDGVSASLTGGTGVIRSNQIDANSGLGIRGRPDYPTLTSAVSSGGTTTISGWVRSRALLVSRDVELFASATCDDSGFGEGATPIALLHVFDDGGIGFFTIVVPVALAPGSFVTGTANPGFRFEPGTSGFSMCQVVTGSSPTPTITPTPPPTPTPTPTLQVLAIAPASGIAGGATPVTVTGAGLLPGASLTIVGVLAEDVIVVGPTEIHASTPLLSPGTLNAIAVTNAPLMGRPLQTAILENGWLGDFLDVPQSEIFHDSIEKIFRHGITAGYGDGSYGFDDAVSRAQMAVLLLKGAHGSDYAPPPCTGVFQDVECLPVPAFAVDWIEQLFHEGITAGCLPIGNYCPNAPVRRDEMAIFLLKSKHGGGYTPLHCTGIFADVECAPIPAFAVDWIERLYEEGITAGCLPAGHYCPGTAVTRGQMAVFLVNTFALP